MMAAPTLTDTELAEVRAILRAILPPGVTAHVFGSRARGNPKPWSDLDLALEAPEPLPLSLLAQLAEAFDECTLPWKVDIVDRKAVSPGFASVIAESGIPLD